MSPRPKRDPQVHVLVCGGRDWDDGWAIPMFVYGLRSYYGLGVHIWHGAAAGADTEAAEAAKETNGIITHPFPAEWDRYSTNAGPIRNRTMLDALLAEANHPEDVRVCLAAKDGFRNKVAKINAHKRPTAWYGGTEDCVAICIKAGIPVYHLERL